MDIIDVGIYLFWAMLIVAIIIILAYSIINMISNPKNAKKTLFQILAVIVIGVASYFISRKLHYDVYEETLAESLKYEMSVKQVVAVGMGIIMFYILAAAAIGSVIYAEISKVLSK